MMNRRTLLAWLSRLLATASTFLIGIPGVSFVFANLRSSSPKKTPLQRVARLQDLPEGKPVQVNVTGSRRDAWTTYPDEVLGRVWLVRTPSGDSANSSPAVKAMTSVCPHLGCAVQLDPAGKQFICPCHRASFAFTGSRLSEKGKPGHAPRDLDSLDCQIVTDERGDQWVEVAYQQFEHGLTTKVSKS